jgi:GTPase SAR1 family protein
VERKGGAGGGSSDTASTKKGQSSRRLNGKENAQSDAERCRNKDIEKLIQMDQRSDEACHKLLLLGAGESGKSTLFKQMITIYGKGFSDAERKTYRSVVCGNIIASIKTLCQQSEQYGPVGGENEGAKREMDNIGSDDIDEKLGSLMLTLWNDAGIQKTYENRARYQLTDSTAYFFDRLPEVMKPDYLPSEQDVLRSRVRTTGIVENEFVIDGNTFKMFDVGGQRNERKKWIHCFENVTCVLFVAAISEYDQYLYEDENTNRMHEALNLFDSICNSRWFAKTSFILFLNKADLFQEKIKRVPITGCFPDYKGPQEYDSCVKYIEGKFQDLNKTADKQIYVHVTCATDTQLVKKVFEAVKNIVLRNALRDSGLSP